MTCPECKGPATKAIYAGLPMKLCVADNDCGLAWGFFSRLLLLSFNGAFMTYEGSYLMALKSWLTKGPDLEREE